MQTKQLIMFRIAKSFWNDVISKYTSRSCFLKFRFIYFLRDKSYFCSWCRSWTFHHRLLILLPRPSWLTYTRVSLLNGKCNYKQFRFCWRNPTNETICYAKNQTYKTWKLAACLRYSSLLILIASLCSVDQWSCHETVPPLSGWKDGPGKKVHPQGPWWYTPFYPGRGGSNSPGESRRVNGPEFIPHYTEMNVPQVSPLELSSFVLSTGVNKVASA